MMSSNSIKLGVRQKMKRKSGSRKCGCVYASKANTPAVRSGHELGGYLKYACYKHSNVNETLINVKQKEADG